MGSPWLQDPLLGPEVRAVNSSASWVHAFGVPGDLRRLDLLRQLRLRFIFRV